MAATAFPPSTYKPKEVQMADKLVFGEIKTAVYLKREHGHWKLNVRLPDWMIDDIVLDGEENRGIKIEVRQSSPPNDSDDCLPTHLFGHVLLETIDPKAFKEEHPKEDYWVGELVLYDGSTTLITGVDYEQKLVHLKPDKWVNPATATLLSGSTTKNFGERFGWINYELGWHLKELFDG